MASCALRAQTMQAIGPCAELNFPGRASLKMLDRSLVVSFILLDQPKSMCGLLACRLVLPNCVKTVDLNPTWTLDGNQPDMR